MNKSCVFLVCLLISVMLRYSIASEQNATEIIVCSLPGRISKEVLFFINNKNKEIVYQFKREGKVELRVLFNENNKLKRLTDSKMGVTYYGFSRGAYSYVINVITGAEEDEYSMVFDVKKNNKIIQSNDCLPGSFINNDIPNYYMTDIVYPENDNFVFP
ncbi:hypothetical protein [Intestinirhabdus alba]|jgi:hypothetical protein|uniref:Uncharacterized protein n=1 Tax=Intestinirhabdus alba TaxID=2899544 RepID=A0A6L6IP80_9ENTR|nr:hypothetical protein [Intestinirhabdus alba]MTH47707.1 hypothetical protein [Intestinirhabdus alba]